MCICAAFLSGLVKCALKLPAVETICTANLDLNLLLAHMHLGYVTISGEAQEFHHGKQERKIVSPNSDVASSSTPELG